MVHLNEQLGQPGLFDLLVALDDDERTRVPVEEALPLTESRGVVDPLYALHQLQGLGLISRVNDEVGLSTMGIKVTLLLRAINGEDIAQVFYKLRRLDTHLSNYSLVREGMTTGFFKSLALRPDLGSLYVCSPWINLTTTEVRYLRTSILRRQRYGGDPDIFVITRPDDGRGTRSENLNPFRALGATIFLNGKLHTKLYIREPGVSGGFMMAIVGSQNLTRSKFLELGIRIEADSVLIRQLIGYFFNISHYSTELT